MSSDTERPLAAAMPSGDALPPGGDTGGRRRGRKQQRLPGESRVIAGLFVLPAAIWLLAIVVYPLLYTAVRSLFGDGPSGEPTGFVGIANYRDIFTQSDSLEAFRNNVIWVVVVPALVTVIGLIFAVLTERVRWASAFKIVVFTPMAISFLAAGITWSLIYVDQPSEGLGNALLTGIHDTFAPGSSYPNLQASTQTHTMTGSQAAGFTTKNPATAGAPALIAVTGLDLADPPPQAAQATTPRGGDGVSGVVWNDFRKGGGGTAGQIDQGEFGVPGLTVEAVRDGKVVASTTTGDDGSFSFPDLTSGSYALRLPHSDFSAPYNGVSWLGPSLITPAIIVAYLWIYAGFAMVLLAAGMAALPRETLEAARIDGATEWQVFRRVTMPLLSPVLLVVFVTMVINVLKIFDIVFVLQQPAGGNARYANVLAVQLYNEYGNQQYGAASAVGILLVLLVVPAMIFQIRNFKKERG